MSEKEQTILEAAEGYAYGGISDELKPLMKPLADEIIRNFIAGAKWQAEKCDEETSKLLYAERQTAYINGWHDCKEQMMKNAVEVDVDDLNGEIYNNCIEKGMTGEDKVRIFIVKED